MTQRLDKVKTDKVRGPSSNLATNGPEAQKENKHSSPDKIRRLQASLPHNWDPMGAVVNNFTGSMKLNFNIND